LRHGGGWLACGTDRALVAGARAACTPRDVSGRVVGAVAPYCRRAGAGSAEDPGRAAPGRLTSPVVCTGSAAKRAPPGTGRPGVGKRFPLWTERIHRGMAAARRTGITGCGSENRIRTTGV